MRSFWSFVFILIFLVGFSSSGWSHDNNTKEDLTDLPFERLLNMDVASASKIARQISDAPSAVSIVTADDIRAYGYRTVADIVNSMPGLYTPYDRSILYLGGRGFGRSGDYVGRILLMIDGYATNDNIYDEAYIGNDGLLDTELIERVEYVPGTGSATYGNNAFFGIINIITKKGADFNGVQVGGELASYGGRKGRVTYGKQLENGADLLLSASVLHNDGQDFYFPEFDNAVSDPNFLVNHGVARNLDRERSPRVFGKLSYDGWTIEGGYVSRKHANPTGAYNALFNALTQDWDTNGFLSAKVDSEINPNLKSTTHFYYGYYLDRTEITDKDTGAFLHEHNRGQWVGADAKLVGSWFENHRLLLGFEYRDDFEMSFKNSVGSSEHSRTTASVYFQDEISIFDDFKLNIGGRYDQATDVSGKFSPRVAAIYSFTPATTIKASYSSAFRMPTAYEKFYQDMTQVMNNNLGPEFVRTSELVLQHQFSPNFRFTSSLYHYETDDIISNLQLLSGHFQNINSGTGHTKGLELALEKNWTNGVRMRSSFAYQAARDTDGLHMINSPDILAKWNLTFPMIQNLVRTGIEVQYTGDRLTEKRLDAPSYVLTNLTFSSMRDYHGMNASFSIRNLFDQDYVAVAPQGYVQDTLKMDGRNVWLQLTYDLK